MSASELATIIGLVGGPTGLLAAFLRLRSAPRDQRAADQTLVLSAGQSGVEILNGANAALTGVVTVLQGQIDRGVAHREHLEGVIARLETILAEEREERRLCAEDRRRAINYIRQIIMIANQHNVPLPDTPQLIDDAGPGKPSA